MVAYTKSNKERKKEEGERVRGERDQMDETRVTVGIHDVNK